MSLEHLVEFILATFPRVNEATIEYVRNLYAHARGAKCIMEIGIGPDAVSATVFAAAMGYGGVLYSLDIDPGRPTKAQRDVINAFGASWVVSHGDTLHSNFSPGRVVDLLYIDGNHDNEHIANDYAKWGPWVKRGGSIIFDDCNEDSPPIAGNGTYVEYDTAHKNGHYIYIVP